MNNWKVRKSLLPWVDKIVETGMFGTDRDEVVNCLVANGVTELISCGVIDAEVKKPSRWFPKLRR